MNAKKKVLIIDDEVDFCLLVKGYLARKNYDVFFVHSLAEGTKAIKEVKPDILLLDNNLPDGLGWDRTSNLVEQRPGMQVYLISAYHPMIPSLRDNSQVNIIEKPISLNDLDRFLK